MRDINYDLVVSYPRNGYGVPFHRKTVIRGISAEAVSFRGPSLVKYHIRDKDDIRIVIDHLKGSMDFFVNNRIMFSRTKTSLKLYNDRFIETVDLDSSPD